MPRDPSNPSAGRLEVGERDGAPALVGVLVAATVPDARRALAAAAKARKHAIDLSGLSHLDTAGGLMLCACVADAGGWPVGVGSRPERQALAPAFGAETGTGEKAEQIPASVAEVAVDGAFPSAVQGVLSYALPVEWRGRIGVGQLVWVPLRKQFARD